ncbi:hypothetical protein [Buttiauxella sp. S19-1]|jgi:hypothetical protein|uniref:hypothetical protein n=1 Tax=Buttiauxella sp. S19-1 TaxID=941430 RepID=UPI001EDC4271|nr:hypothetical protein [Buttiauxella sp. S19-1]
MNISQPVTPSGINATITLDDLRCLEHLLRVGQFAGDLLEHQECTVMNQPPAQQTQLASLLFLMTTQLDAVVERCNMSWMAPEKNQ